ncbi:hypothetical protein GM418_04580 [Maribellus comscasis]|uniref:STAS/SEC14 domain-containing protein n=1 Tax=Maribellus comscasis TaxID=2681766 RepID=A0A6I6JPI1_9BACT|nr:STAS/SEC14 domain-containing protein [Maribellus comscasis]QGY42958.1 hypothetical protein GM418_04580 [Maribellus comscasis]
MFQVLDITQKDLIAIKVDGNNTKNDYDKITPLIEKSVEKFGKIKFYVQLDNVKSITPTAFREDLKTYVKHFDDIDKIAVVGENAWQKLWSNLATPFVSGTVEYFSHEDIAEARNWIID